MSSHDSLARWERAGVRARFPRVRIIDSMKARLLKHTLINDSNSNTPAPGSPLIRKTGKGCPSPTRPKKIHILRAPTKGCRQLYSLYTNPTRQRGSALSVPLARWERAGVKAVRRLRSPSKKLNIPRVPSIDSQNASSLHELETSLRRAACPLRGAAPPPGAGRATPRWRQITRIAKEPQVPRPLAEDLSESPFSSNSDQRIRESRALHTNPTRQRVSAMASLPHTPDFTPGDLRRVSVAPSPSSIFHPRFLVPLSSIMN